jgi:prepilin-type N-terminal cleavage/methylation domain-containing protein
MPAIRRSGFTLIELIAGLALVGFLFASMLMLVDQLRDGRDRLLAQARRDNRVANGLRVLHALIARVEAGADTTERFTGGALGASFVTWCDVPGGWLERCRADLFTERSADSAFLRAVLSTGERLELISTAGTAGIRYFDATSNDPQWVSSWGRSTALPAAVEFDYGSDTTVVRAGGRG